ncbi:MAG: hypothetical protein AAF615_01795 [Pseudomonadota bacterium]
MPRIGAGALVVAVVASLGLSAPVLAEDDKPRWFASVSDTDAFARWGIPETDAVGFEVVCSTGDVVLRPALYAMEKPAELPQIRFSVDGEDYLRDAKFAFSELDAAWQAETVVERQDGLVDAMRRGSELTYDFDPPLRTGDEFTLSLSGSAKAIDEALEGC